MPHIQRTHAFTLVACLLALLTLISLVLLLGAIRCRTWDAATAYATLLAGLVAAHVVVWQGTLIRCQLAFSTYLELDKEWNSKEMIRARKAVHTPDRTCLRESQNGTILPSCGSSPSRR
jgi:ATP/ADP translocase